MLFSGTAGVSPASVVFRASMTQWMSESGKISMDDVLLAQLVSLRAQIKDKRAAKKKKK
jgi:hypothetical protein